MNRIRIDVKVSHVRRRALRARLFHNNIGTATVPQGKLAGNDNWRDVYEAIYSHVDACLPVSNDRNASYTLVTGVYKPTDSLPEGIRELDEYTVFTTPELVELFTELMIDLGYLGRILVRRDAEEGEI